VAGSRFVEAERFFAEAAERMRAHGWPRAARVARHRVSSRLFALSLLPGAVRAGNPAAVGTLARHAFSVRPDGTVSGVTADASTEDADYTERLVRLEQPRWKRLLDVQAPYRWNVRRLFGDREVLDVGCGVGRNLAHLAPRAVGVDHNAHSVAVCRQRGLTAFTTDEFGATEYARRGRFGGLLAAHLVEHMTRPEAVEVLAGYLNYLAPGARVVLICPQERGYATDRTHVEFTDFDALADVATRLGLTVHRRMSFPLPRAAGRVFPYNEFVLVASTPG
jgi:SAM-dependent methyltransferase